MQVYNPVNLDLDEIFKDVCCPDYARMFIHIILATTYKLKHKETEFVPLSSLCLRKQIHAKKTELIKNILINQGIIECDGRYCKALKCYGYRLTKKYLGQVKNIKLKNQTLLKKTKSNLPKTKTKQHQKIWHWLNKVEIDYEKAINLLQDTEHISQKSFMLEKLRNKDLFLTIDQRGRVYHNVSCLWSKFRPLLTINKQNLVNVDIKNSQPLLFCKVFKEILYIIYSTKNVAPDDVQLFTTLTQDGVVYDFLMDEFGIDDRNHFKKRFFAEIFYSKLGFETELSRKFAKLFPNVVKVINYCKKDDYKDLPLKLQKIEADLMIDQVCAELDFPFLTVHDSILTFPQHVDKVKSVITMVFNKSGLNPSFGA